MDTEISLGGTNLFVPDSGRVFVAPSMVAHYIDSHDYQPPLEFQAAVLRLGNTTSIEYLRILKESGIKNE